MLLISLFVLGGGFWNKLRALFHYDASAGLGMAGFYWQQGPEGAQHGAIGYCTV